MTNDFQVEFFSFNYQKQWKLSVFVKKSLTKLEWTDTLRYDIIYLLFIKGRGGVLQISQRTFTDKSCEAIWQNP